MESQEKILESLSINDYKKIILPEDDFLDCKSVSSISDSENVDETIENKKKYRFGNNIYEKYSSYYLAETVLNIENAQYVKFPKRVNINELTTYNKTSPCFDENLFSILLNFCKKEKENIIFNPDYIINNVSGNQLMRILNFKENIQCLRNWIKKDKIYDLIGEVSIDYLTNPKERKLKQTLKYIKIIKLLKEIDNEKNIDLKKKTKFHELFGLVH